MNDNVLEINLIDDSENIDVSLIDDSQNINVEIMEKDTTVPDCVREITQEDIESWDNKSDFSGDYNDLTNKPTIPSKTSDLDNDSGFIDNTVDDLQNYTKSSSLSAVATSGDYNDLSNTPTIPVVPTNVSAFTNDAGYIDKNVNNLTYYTLKTSTGSMIDLEINGTTYVITLSLKDIDGNVISSDTIDLPLESVVVGGEYDAQNQKIVLTLENGNKVDIPVGALISGLQTEITSQNKLASDLVDDSNSGNKFVTTSEKSTWNAKYEKPSGGIPSTDLAETYVKPTDYASGTVAGVIKTFSGNNLYVTSSGGLAASTNDYTTYQSKGEAAFIGKGTLENAIAGKGLVSNTDYATGNTGGVIKASSFRGTGVTNAGYLEGVVKDYSTYNDTSSTGEKCFISKGTLENVVTGKELVNNSTLNEAKINTTLPFMQFDGMTPIATYEYDIADKVYHPIYTIANTGWTRFNMDIRLAYRITTTLTISNVEYTQRTDIVELWHEPLTYPTITMLNKTDAGGNASSGVSSTRAVYVTSSGLNNTNYLMGREIIAYDTTSRHIKVEVFKTDANVTWMTQNTATIYSSSTYQGNIGLQTRNSRGWCFQKPAYFVSTASDAASYVNSYEPATINSSSIKTGASNITKYNCVFLADDGKVYAISNTTANISMGVKKVGVLTTGVNANTAITSTYFRTLYLLDSTLSTYTPHATMVLGNRLFLRCTMDANGKIHSDNYVDTEMRAGYTWMPFGIATGSSTMYMDTRNQPFYTLNANGELTHIDGLKIAGVS